MKALLTMATTIALAISPASAQLLGGGGLGGSLGGGALGGIGNGSGLGGMAEGTLSGRGETSGTQRVDRRSGSVSADRAVGGALGGAAQQTLDTPRGQLDAGGSGNASGSGNVNGTVQLIGTDAARETLGSTRSAVGDTVGSARSTVRSTTDYARTTGRGAVSDIKSTARNGAATARGAARASTDNAVSAAGNQLAIAGSAASGAAGAVAVQPGMIVQSAKGKTIGTVHEVVADSRGRVQSLVVASGDRLATVPAGNFSGNGDVLFTGMTKSDLKAASRAQAKEAADPNS